MINADILEAARDPRPTNELLAGLPCLANGDTKQPWWNSDRYYQFYSALAKVVRPCSVLEIGVRLGYSLIAMLKGYPGIHDIVGFDNESGVAGSQQWAEKNLKHTDPPYEGRLRLPVVWTNLVPPSEWPIDSKERFTLIHVDGDHTYQGTLALVISAWKLLESGGVLVVDDYDASFVRAAVIHAFPALKEDLFYCFSFPTFTGWWVGVKSA